PLTLAAWTSITTSSGAATGSGRSPYCRTSGPPNFWMNAAFIALLPCGSDADSMVSGNARRMVHGRRERSKGGSVCPGRSAAPQARLRASSTRYGGALQTRDRHELRILGGPGSAAHHFARRALVLRCARDTRPAASFRTIVLRHFVTVYSLNIIIDLYPRDTYIPPSLAHRGACRVTSTPGYRVMVPRVSRRSATPRGGDKESCKPRARTASREREGAGSGMASRNGVL